MGNNEWTSLYDIILDLIAAAILVALIVVLGVSTTKANSKIQVENAAVEQVQQYRAYSGYDDKTLLGADVVSCIFTVRGKIPVTACGITYTVSSDYDLNTINALFPSTESYHATLERDPEDKETILGITITEGA